MDNINFKKVLDDGELFDQQANYEENFEKINQLVVPKITDLETNKVDKVAGKGLSTNDFDNTYKQKIDTDIPAQLADKALKNDVGLLSGLLTTAKTSIVNAINELFNSKANKTQPNFETPTLLNGATPWNAYVGFGVRVNELGAIEFRGSLSNLTSGMVVTNLPQAYRPRHNRTVISQRENSTPFYIQLGTNGDLTVFGVSAILSHRHSFDGVVIFK